MIERLLFNLSALLVWAFDYFCSLYFAIIDNLPNNMSIQLKKSSIPIGRRPVHLLILLDTELGITTLSDCAIEAIKLCLREKRCKWLTLQIRSLSPHPSALDEKKRSIGNNGSKSPVLCPEKAAAHIISEIHDFTFLEHSNLQCAQNKVFNLYINHVSAARGVTPVHKDSDSVTSSTLDFKLNINIITKNQRNHFSQTIIDLKRASINSVSADELDAHLTPAPPVDLIVYSGSGPLDLSGLLAWMIGFAQI